MVVPASAASSERSFSMLRRLKTWLRSTMSQKRLNHCAILHAHQEIVQTLDLVPLCHDFISTREYRLSVLGQF